MKSGGLLILGICALVAGSSLAQSTSQGLPKTYDVLTRKSIFARDRVARDPSTPSTAPATAPAPVPPSPVLVGIIREDTGFVAVFESPDTGQLTQAHLGESLPANKGTVVEITLDYVEYVPAPDQPPQQLFVGNNLDGADVGLPSSGSTSSASPSPAAAPIEGDDIVSRMRRRRQQEMNR